MTKSELERLYQYMLSCVADRAHDENHILRVLANALEIAREEQGVDMDVLMAACLLHDVARRQEMQNPALSHAACGAVQAQEHLQSLGYDAAFCQRVGACIAAHSFGSGPAPERIEEKILFDADKLDAAGALGTARMLLFHGAAGDPLYMTDAAGQVTSGENDAQRNFFYEYHGMIAKIEQSMLTAAGRRIAAQRARTARDIYQAVYDEASARHLLLQDAFAALPQE